MIMNHRGWAQTVTHERWAYLADVLFALSTWSGFRILNTAKHRAWQRACGLIVALVAIAVSVGCASTPVKQKAVVGLQASEVALEAAHDLERGLCFVNPALEKGAHCTNAIAASVGLTDARHVALAGYFETAFGVEIKAATALKAWQAGDPAPQSVADYQRDITAILGLAQQLLPPGATPLLGQAQTAVTEGAAIAALVGVK